MSIDQTYSHKPKLLLLYGIAVIVSLGVTGLSHVRSNCIIWMDQRFPCFHQDQYDSQILLMHER